MYVCRITFQPRKNYLLTIDELQLLEQVIYTISTVVAGV